MPQVPQNRPLAIGVPQEGQRTALIGSTRCEEWKT